MLCVGFALSLVAGRLVQVQVMEGPAYRAQADQFRLNTTWCRPCAARSATADGTTLAMTVQNDQVTADPPTIKAAKTAVGLGGQRAGRPAADDPAAILAKL